MFQGGISPHAFLRKNIYQSTRGRNALEPNGTEQHYRRLKTRNRKAANASTMPMENQGDLKPSTPIEIFGTQLPTSQTDTTSSVTLTMPEFTPRGASPELSSAPLT